ncbi:MAG: DUF86 domain-containing protein [Mariprofundaceae bacterium]|nr:DUF86 domain-containing protein [Mariprofundaceae bacterium]
MDDVLLNKAAIIERCLIRVNEEYQDHEHELETDFTRQDAIVLNLQRACEPSIDAAMHLVRIYRLGVPQQSREAFALLADAGMVDAGLRERLEAMVGFRNVAVHDYRKLNLAIVRSIIERDFDDFRAFASILIERAGESDE